MNIDELFGIRALPRRPRLQSGSDADKPSQEGCRGIPIKVSMFIMVRLRNFCSLAIYGVQTS